MFTCRNYKIWDLTPASTAKVNNPLAANTWQIVDKVRAPATKGQYVLRWRWDVEQNPQVGHSTAGPEPHAISDRSFQLLRTNLTTRSGATVRTSLWCEEGLTHFSRSVAAAHA